MRTLLITALSFAWPAITFAQSGAETVNETSTQVESVFSTFLHMLPLWIIALVVFVFSFFWAQFAKNHIEDHIPVQEDLKSHKAIQSIAGRIAYTTVLVIGITAALKIAGLDMTPVVAAAAFGVGFAFKDVAMNFLSGIMILMAGHYSIGDIVKVGSTMGKIQDIKTRETIIRAFDGTKVILPNSTLLKHEVISYTSNPTRRLEIDMGVGYEADLKKTVELTLEALKAVPGVLQDPKPKVTFYEWGDYSINFKIKFWIDHKETSVPKVKHKVIMALSEAYNASDLDIPYPIQTMYWNQVK